VNRGRQKRLKIGFALAAALLVATLAAMARESPQSQDHQKEADAAIRQVLDAQVAAWNKGDLEAYMAGYWNSSDLSFFSQDSVTRGWEPTLNRYRMRYQGEGKEMGRLSFADLQIEPLSPESAFVRGRYQLVLSKETKGGLFTLILKKLPAGWRIVHDHSSS
jgi:ketosteroid isomerase-like protein